MTTELYSSTCTIESGRIDRRNMGFKRGLQLWDRRKKHMSPYTANWMDGFEPIQVTLPTIEPKRHIAAFRAAMDQAEIEFLTSLWYSCYEPKKENI